MFERPKMLASTNTDDKINKQFVSNPIDSVFEKVQKIELCNDVNLKSERISEIVSYINSLSTDELLNLMASKNEIIRSFAARAYVDNSPEFPINKLKLMLKDDSEFIRDAAVMALSYVSSDEILDLLREATKDNSQIIKTKALTGIADIAAECSNDKAKEILKHFLNDDNAEIRRFVREELNFLNQYYFQ